MATFQAAIDLGYRYLETDTRVTRDGVCLAFHDPVLDRVTDRSGVVAELSYPTVAEARIDGEPIPLFEDILGAWPDLKVNVEPKDDASIEAVARCIRRTNAIDRVCVGSFSDLRIRRIRSMLGPRLCTSMGPVGVVRLRLAAGGLPSRSFAAECAQVPVSQRGLTIVNQAFVDTAHRFGLQVHVWTIDDPDEMVRLIEMGVDGLMTDRPVVLKDVLQARGQW